MPDVVILGTLTDWPLGARLTKLVSLPAEALRVPCYQAVGTKAHCKAVEEAVFKRKETISPTLATASDALLGALEACTVDRGGLAPVQTTCGFHGSATVDEVRGDLAKSFDVRTPVEALAARRPETAAALAGIVKELADRSIPQRKALTAYLEGGPLRESLIGISAHDLSYGLTPAAECFGVVDRRLAFLWARCASPSTMFPVRAAVPELGFDRFGAWLEELTAAGVPSALSLDYVLVHAAQHTRWWASTGVYVWEHLAEDAAAFVERVRAVPSGETRMPDILMAMAWLPTQLLDAGGRALLREVCASPSLVPDAAFARLVDDKTAREALGKVERVEADAKSAKSGATTVATGAAARLVKFEGEAAAQATLAALGAAMATPARAPAKRPTAAATAKAAKAAGARAKDVEAALREMVKLAPGKPRSPATSAQLASLEKLVLHDGGALPPELRAYFAFAANLGEALETTANVEPLLSLAWAMRTAKELRTYDAPETLVPLLDYQSGDFACFDVETSKVIFWDHETRGTSALADNLAAALEHLWLRPLRAAAKRATARPAAAKKKTAAPRRAR